MQLWIIYELCSFWHVIFLHFVLTFYSLLLPDHVIYFVFCAAFIDSVRTLMSEILIVFIVLLRKKLFVQFYELTNLICLVLCCCCIHLSACFVAVFYVSRSFFRVCDFNVFIMYS